MTSGRAQLTRAEYLYGYGIEDNTVVYLKKNLGANWQDNWYEEGDEVVFRYQNCFGPLWHAKVKPALNNTSSDALIVVQVFPLEGYFYVTKRQISQNPKGFSTFTVVPA